MVQREVAAELRSPVGLDATNGDRELAAQLLDEVDYRPDAVVIVGFQDRKARRLIDGGELVQTTGSYLDVLDVDLHRLAGLEISRRFFGPGR